MRLVAVLMSPRADSLPGLLLINFSTAFLIRIRWQSCYSFISLTMVDLTAIQHGSRSSIGISVVVVAAFVTS